MSLNVVGGLFAGLYIERPVFVVGASRSGTSVLLQALGAHKHIVSAPGEAPFLTSIGGAVALFEFGDSSDYYNDSLVCSKSFLYGRLKRLALQSAAGEHCGLKAVLKAIHAERRLRIPLHWAAKTFPTRRGADSLKALFPEARFVYIMRNGLEVVQSMTRFDGFRDKAFATNCRRWADSMDTFGYLLEYPAAIAVRHEELKRDPSAVFSRLFGFLGLSMDPKVVDFVQHTVVHPLDQRTKRGASAIDEFVKRPPPYETWSDSEKSQFLELCMGAMERAGYDIPFAK